MNNNVLNNNELQEVNGGHVPPATGWLMEMVYFCPLCGAKLESITFPYDSYPYPSYSKRCVCPTCGTVEAKGELIDMY